MPHTPLLEIKNLTLAFNTERGQIRPVRQIDLCIYPGQTVALVGESGCGKSVTSLSILGLIPSPPGEVIEGEIWFNGRDLLKLNERDMRQVRGHEIAMIFQEPMTSLNPVYTIGDQIAEAIILHQHVSSAKAYSIAADALADVGVADPARMVKDYPHQLSGGMRQRVMIAMALSCQPKLLIADEPTTALDVTIQAQILELLRKLQKERGMSILLITHDLGVVAENADVVAVMYASKIVEFARVEDLFDSPQHPYTQGLFRSMPRLGEQVDRLQTISGSVPSPAKFPPGCKFHPRCPLTQQLAGANPKDSVEIRTSEGLARVMGVCCTKEPPLREVVGGHWGACHFIENFSQAANTPPRLDHRRTVVANSGEEVGAGKGEER